MAFGLRRRQPTFEILNPGSLTASGARIDGKRADEVRRLIQPWQHRALAYYDALGEIKYASQFYARGLAPLRLYAAKKNDKGDWEETQDQAAVQQLDRLRDPSGERTGLLSSYGRLIFLIGECLLLCTRDEESDEEQWEVLSPDELRIMDSGKYYRYRAPSLAAEEYREPSDNDWEPVAGEAVAYRLWRRHPRFSALADSSMQGVLEICEELILLTQTVRARARNRLAGAGLMLIDARIIPPPVKPGADEDVQNDPFMAALIEHMTASIKDEGSASSVVPLTLRVDAPPDYKVADMVAHIQITDPLQLYPETGLRTECIDRIAIGLDMPPEILKGLADANHWSAWMVDEQVWTAHLQPVADQLCEDLTASFYRPSLRDAGVKDWQKYAIRYDATSIINHPDRSTDAKALWDRGELSGEELRKANGFNEAAKQNKSEHNEYLGRQLRDSSLAVYGTPSLRSGTELEPSADVIQSPPPPGEAESAAAETVKKGPPPKTPAEQPQGPEQVPALNAARIIGASELALLRAREVAGNRLLSVAKRDAAAAAVLNERKPRSGDVAACLGRDTVKRLGMTETTLVAGAAGILTDAFRVFRIEPEIAERLSVLVLEHAARTLYESRPMPLPPSYAHYVAGLTTPLTPA